MKQIQALFEQIHRQKMLVIFPHPDDESVMAGGLIQQAMKYGFEVEVMSLTAGEAGQIHCKGKGKSLREIRRAEMTQAMKKLGVKKFRVLDFPDGRLKQDGSWPQWLKDNIDWKSYGLVVTYDHSGISGHPDHISASLKIKDQISNIKDEDGPLLLWVSMEGIVRSKMVNLQVQKYLVEPEYVVNLSLRERFRKWQAVKAHKSQALGKHFPMPLLVLLMVFGKEYCAVADLHREYEYKYVEFKI